MLLDARPGLAYRHCHEASIESELRLVLAASYQAVVVTGPLGLGIRTAGAKLTGIDFLPPGVAEQDAQTAMAEEVVRQIRAYFRGERRVFDVPLALAGTAFQRRVWRALQHIPLGARVSYGELAGALGTSARAVGGACRANPVPLIVPCHRVVARSGMGGFAGCREGTMVHIKQWLLAHEAGMSHGRS